MVISDILAHLIELTSNVTNAFTTALFAVDHEKKVLVLREHLSLSQNFNARVQIPIGKGPIGEVAMTGKSCVIDHFDQDASQWKLYKKPEALKSFLAVPVIYKRLEGVLVMDTKEAYSFSVKQQKIVQGFAVQMAWHLAQGKRGLNSRNGNGSPLREVNSYSRFIAQSPNREAVAERLIRIPSSVFKADAAAVIWFRGIEASGHIQKHRGFSQDLSKLKVIPGKGIVGACAKNRSSALIKVSGDHKAVLFSENEKPEPLKSIGAVPITFNGNLLGVVVCGSKNRDGFSHADLDKLSLIASSASTALFCTETKSRWDYAKKKDYVTGVPNHLFLKDHHRAIAEKIFKEKAPVFFLTAQITNLSEIFDSYGTKRGNLLLRQMASMFSKAIPGPKLLFKYSDTTFLLILMNRDRDDVYSLEGSLKNLFNNHSFYIDGKSLTVKTEWGLSSFPEDGNDLLRLIGLSWARTSQQSKAPL